MTDQPFANPLPVPPSVSQVEQARQADVAQTRAVLMGNTMTATPQDRADGVPWLLLAVLALMTAYAVGQRNAEVRSAELTAPLEARIATLEAENVKLNNEIAAIEGHVEEKIDAYAMVEANRIVEDQP